MRKTLRVALLAAIVAVAMGCSSLADPPPALDGTTWVAIRVAGKAPVPGNEPDVSFQGDRIIGTAGCNGYFAKVRIEGTRIAVQDLKSTDMGCPALVASFEPLFLNALGLANSIRSDGEDLVIGGDGGEIVFRLTTEPRGFVVELNGRSV